MTHINFLSNLYAKVLQNIGGGTSRHKALIITKQFSQYCVSQSEGAQVRSARSAVDVPMTSYGASDEHPMSIRSASDGESWKTRGWKYVAMIFAVLVMSMANVGMAWGTVRDTYSLSDLANSGLLYEKSGLSGDDQKLSKGEKKVEVPCADASGTLYFNGTREQSARYASIWGSNGTSYDASRQVSMTSGYGAGISFTSADIMTEGGKYYIIFGARKSTDYDDFKIAGFKYVLNSECSASGRSFEPGEIVYIKDIKIDGDACMKILGKNIWAVFVDEAGTSSDWAQGDLEKGNWDAEGAIYKMVVPARKDPSKKYVKVIFTRDDWAKQTVDLTTTEPNNLYNLSNNWSGGKLTGGTWGFYTPASKTVYFDNRNVPDWTTAYVRIGHGSWNSAWGTMTKVAGTQHLYTQSTSQWDNHTLFSIANTAGWTDGKNIYQPYEEGGNIKPNDEYKMSKQTNYQKYPIISDAYLCPSGTSVLERGCQYYKVNSSTSTSTFDDDNRLVFLPSYTVTSSASHCTVAMEKYNDDAGSSTTVLASGGTVLPTQYVKVTVTPDANYQFGSVEVTGAGTVTAAAAGTPGVYYIIGDATITATCTCVALAVNIGGTAATPAEGEPLGTAYGTLTCSATTGVIASYQWKQNTSASTEGAVNAQGTGATTASFSPNPESAGTYYYYCVATDACGNSANTSFSGAFKFNAAAYTVTYNKNGDGAGGAGSVTGTVPSDATSYTSDQRPVVKGPGDLARDGYTFIGWNDKADGSGTYYSEKANFAISASKTLYAQWRTASSCPGSAGGTVFSLSMNNNTSSTIAFNYGESKLLSSYATIQRGDASFTDIRTSNSPEGTKATITKASPAKLKIEGNDVTIMLFLDCALQQGDVLTFTETNNRQLYITTTPSRETTIATTSNSYTIPAESPLIGKRVIYLWRNSSTYNIDAITITRPKSVAATITATKTSPDYVSTDPNNLVLSISTTGASSGWYYRVKNTKTDGYQTPENTPYNTATWTMTSGLSLGANNFVVELYDGSHVKQAESATITVTAETAYPVTIIAGAGGSVNPSGEIKANESGNHIHPEITATPDAGYHFVNWTLSNANATLANKNAATTTITNAIAACTITANFAEDAAPATKDIYYGQVAIADGALVREITNGATQFFTNIGGTVANNTEISLSSTPSTTGMYYNSNNLTDAELSKSSNWSTSSGSNRYIRGLKFANGATYTLALGTKVASAITFYGWCGSTSKVMTIGGEEYTSSSTKNTFAKHEFTKSGGFTGNVSITETGDFYGILVITIQTATPCTTPELPSLSNQTVCEGSDIAAWNATVTNASAISTAGETVAYSWKKKGNDTELANTATFDLGSATEAMAGTYVVTATVSKTGYASSMATKEVTLSVTEATATPTITANANTIYTGNSVTLTATCASSGVTYQWYKCTDADGTNAQAIDGETNATYTLTAGEAGTYYYKVIVTGDGTHSCGTAEKVYTLVVSTSNSGETTCGEIKGQFTSGAYTFDTDFIIYGINSNGNLYTGASSSQGNSRCGGSGSYLSGQRFVVTFPVDVLSFSFIGYQSTGRTVKAVKTTTDLKTADTEYTTITHTAKVSQEGNCQTHVITPKTAIPANTFVWVELSNGLNISEICYVPVSNVTCTDPQVTVTVDNATVCAGTESTVTFTANNAADGATFQWQKKNGNTWDNISEVNSATYTISSVTTEHAGQYRVIAEKGCKRISEEVTLTVLTAPTFNTFATTASVMKGNALAISDVEATNATGYAWYKSADDSFNAAEDKKVWTTKELLLAAASIPEAADQTFYLFCVASNSCGSVTSNAITVTVTPFVEEECATKGNETNDRDFGFTNTSCSSETYESRSAWKSTGSSKYLTYTAPERKYFATAKVTVAHTKANNAVYGYSTDKGTTWTYVAFNGLSTAYTTITIELPENVNAFRIGRNMDGKGESSGSFYLAEACFTYKNACTETTLTPSQNTYEYNISTQADFVEPTCTLKAGETTLVGQTLTYTSSNTAIATVDEEGNVTFEGMTGTVTITAEYAGTTIDEIEYCASEGSYTITVSCSDEAPKVVAASGTNMSECNTSITLEAKMENGNSFTGGTYQWYRDGEAIEGATSASYEVVRAGTYTVSRTDACITMSSNSAIVKNDNVEPEVERLTPFQYYHVNKTYSNQMKDRHLFAVKSYGMLDGKRYHLTATRNGEALNLSSSTAFFTIPSKDNTVDTVMIDLNKLKDKYSEGDKIVITCAPINNCNQVSPITSSITIHVIDQTPTLALICSGANGDGTRETDKLVVGGDFLTGYNVADLCQQTSNTTFDAKTEWGLYTDLKANYIVTPVNGYAVFNKLNYEPFDILLLTDYPKASKSPAAATVLDDMADLCDYRPMLSFKTHMVAKSPSKWAAKGFTTSPVVSKTDGCLNLNIVCYAHPMFESLTTGDNVYKDNSDLSQLVYTMLSEPGYESSKGMQGFEIAAAENFVTIGLTHYNASIAKNSPSEGKVKWTPNDGDRMLVTVAERQTNIEARFILFSLNCGAQSKLTEKGEDVILACLEYLLDDDPLHVADCSLTFDNGAGNTTFDAGTYTGSGVKGDGKWSTEANWGPQYLNIPGEFNSARIAAPVTVDMEHAKAMELRIIDEGSITIPAGKALQVKSTIRRMDGSEIYPTEISDIHIGSASTGNGTLIFDNNSGDTKAQVDMYSKGFIDHSDPAKEPKGVKNYQYIGTPFIEVNALYNYYGSWIYYWGTKTNGKLGWVAVKNGGPMTAWTGYCITQEAPTYYQMSGTLAATGTVDINVPADANMVVGNSWTAPIDINALTTDDLEGLKANIYFFNTGVDKTGTAGAAGSRYAGSTYVTIPVEAARYEGEDDHINSLQGFFVKNPNGSAGTLHLDYERHVRQTTRGSIIGDELHAPARRTALSSDEPTVLKIKVSGENYDDKLLLLERVDFTEGFDNGWDGDKWDGNESALYIYTTDNNGTENSVSAIPELEGTIIGFRAGEDDAYTLNFEYLNSDEPLYLYDVENNTYTQIMTGMTYRFFTTDNEKHARFIITRSNGQEVATGVGEVPSDQVQGTKAKKLLIGNKMFIMVNGMLYDATGKVVK